MIKQRPTVRTETFVGETRADGRGWLECPVCTSKCVVSSPEQQARDGGRVRVFCASCNDEFEFSFGSLAALQAATDTVITQVLEKHEVKPAEPVVTKHEIGGPEPFRFTE